MSVGPSDLPACGAPPPGPSDLADTSDSGGGLSTGAIVGIAVGGLAALCCECEGTSSNRNAVERVKVAVALPASRGVSTSAPFCPCTVLAGLAWWRCGREKHGGTAGAGMNEADAEKGLELAEGSKGEKRSSVWC